MKSIARQISHIFCNVNLRTKINTEFETFIFYQNKKTENLKTKLDIWNTAAMFAVWDLKK